GDARHPRPDPRRAPDRHPGLQRAGAGAGEGGQAPAGRGREPLMGMDRTFEQDFIRITEQAAIAAAKTMGFGDRRHSDHVAVEAMRQEMDSIAMDGRIVIGEGERDKAPLLYTGEEVGARRGDPDAPRIDIAVDPLEGTNLCATGSNDAVAVLAAAERGGLLYAPDVYMD